MYTNKSIRLHSKCLNILELIQQANNRIVEISRKIELYDRVDFLHPIRLMNTPYGLDEKRERTKTIKEYLVSKYSATMQQLLSETSRQLILSQSKTAA